jgi:hypothetical protein
MSHFAALQVALPCAGAAQAFSQSPQCAGSLSTLVQLPSHAVSDAAQPV